MVKHYGPAKSVGQLRAALKDVPDEALLNIGNREYGYEVHDIGYDGTSAAIMTNDAGDLAQPVHEETFEPDDIDAAIAEINKHIPHPADKMVDGEHLQIALAWLKVKKALTQYRRLGTVKEIEETMETASC